MSWSNPQKAEEDPNGPLWINGYSSSNGGNDQVPENHVSTFSWSLYLVHPEVFSSIVALEGGNFGSFRKRVPAVFKLCGPHYCLAVTDPVGERENFRFKDGRFKIEDALLCVSLGELYYGNAYKLATAVITS